MLAELRYLDSRFKDHLESETGADRPAELCRLFAMVPIIREELLPPLCRYRPPGRGRPDHDHGPDAGHSRRGGDRASLQDPGDARLDSAVAAPVARPHRP
jgi:hypothetical protein